jgi:hypothetical protein
MAKSKVVSVGIASGWGAAKGVGRGWSRPPENHEVYNLIGRVSSEWAYLEHMLDLIIWEMASVVPPKGACITAQLMGVWPRINSIIALLTFYQPHIPSFEPFIKQVRKFGVDCQGPAESRNRITHDPWYSEQHDDKLVAQHRKMPKGNLRYGLEHMDKAVFTSLIDAICSLSERARQFKNEISAMLLASQ